MPISGCGPTPRPKLLSNASKPWLSGVGTRDDDPGGGGSLKTLGEGLLATLCGGGSRAGTTGLLGAGHRPVRPLVLLIRFNVGVCIEVTGVRFVFFPGCDTGDGLAKVAANGIFDTEPLDPGFKGDFEGGVGGGGLENSSKSPKSSKAEDATAPAQGLGELKLPKSPKSSSPPWSSILAITGTFEEGVTGRASVAMLA